MKNRGGKLKRVTVPMEIDTDTLGLTLFSPDKDSGKEFSTSSFLKTIKEKIENTVSENLGPYGSYKTKFSYPQYFLEYYRDVVSLTEVLMNDPNNVFGAKNAIDTTLNLHFNELTQDQKQAVSFVLIRSIAMQYMVGLGMDDSGKESHMFTHHNERCMALSLSGKTVSRFDPGKQIFGSTPSTSEGAIDVVNIQMALLDRDGKADKPYVLFISEPIDRRMWEESINGENETTSRTIAQLRQLHGELTNNVEIHNRLMYGDLRIVAVLVDEKSGKVLYQEDFGQPAESVKK